jgi:hypothetical protein
VSKKDGEYVGLSEVMDYKYCPKQFKDIALYDWMRLYEKSKRPKSEFQQFHQSMKTEPCDDNDLPHRKRKRYIANVMKESLDYQVREQLAKDSGATWADDHAITESDEEDLSSASDSDSDNSEYDGDNYSEYDSDDENGWIPLLNDHPQEHTHMVRIQSEKKEKIPSFVGGTLPRHDIGDREYYCCTMLTFFKPWRTGRELKMEDQSWNEAFANFQFTERQQEVMNFFCIPYECLDARDDHAAQRKRDAKNDNSILFGGLYSYGSFDDTLHDLDEHRHDHDILDGDDVPFDEDILNEGPLGKHALNRIKKCRRLRIL